MAESEAHRRLLQMVRLELGNGCGRIVVAGPEDGLVELFDELELIQGRMALHQVADADMVVLDDAGQPIMFVEAEATQSPKSFGRSLLVYSEVQSMMIRCEKDRHPRRITSQPCLVIVVPEGTKVIGKDDQLARLEAKWKHRLCLEGSRLRDFKLCRVDRIRDALMDLGIIRDQQDPKASSG